jgi:hypothetical protein
VTAPLDREARKVERSFVITNLASGSETALSLEDVGPLAVALNTDRPPNKALQQTSAKRDTK